MTDQIQEEFICSHQKEYHYEFSITLGISHGVHPELCPERSRRINRRARNDMLLDVTILHFSFK